MKYVLMVAVAAVVAGCGSADTNMTLEIKDLKANITTLQAENAGLKSEITALKTCNTQMAKFLSFVFPQPGIFSGMVTNDEMIQKAQAFRAACAPSQ